MNKKSELQPVECPECGLDINSGELYCPFCEDQPNPGIEFSDLFEEDEDEEEYEDEEIKTEPYTRDINKDLFGAKNHDFEFINDNDKD